MKTSRIALSVGLAVLLVSACASMAADQAKEPAKAAAPVKSMQVAKQVSITGTVKCYKDEKGVLTGGSVIADSGRHYKVATADLQKISAFDGQKVSVSGMDKDGALSIDKIEAVKEAAPAK